MEQPLILSVVGHTNTGKTSFLRTLLKDPFFGEVSALAGTTREVTMAKLSAGQIVVAELFDTPGLEDSQALYAYLQSYFKESNKHDTPAVLAEFLQSKAATVEFEQEAKVIRQLLKSDAAFFVIDTRMPVLEKYLDELAILRMAAKPIIPVLNFLQQETDVLPWQMALRRVHLHNSVLFDTQNTSLQHEIRLLEQCMATLPFAREQLQQLAQARQDELLFKLQATTLLLAETLVNVASYRMSVAADNVVALNHLQGAFKDLIIEAENRCLQAILATFAFQLGDARLEQLPIQQGCWQQHSFSAEAWRHLGIKAGTGVVAGGTLGAGVDVLTGGVSLGMGTLLGAVAGGVYQSAKKVRHKLQAQLTGKVLMQVEPQVVQMIFKRQFLLIKALMHRGHAATNPVVLKLDHQQEIMAQAIKQALANLNQELNWSQLDSLHFTAGTVQRITYLPVGLENKQRRQFVQALAEDIRISLQQA